MSDTDPSNASDSEDEEGEESDKSAAPVNSGPRPYPGVPEIPAAIAHEPALRVRTATMRQARRSYRVMELLQTPSKALQSFIKNRLEFIVTKVFTIFEPTNNGNFFHFARVIEHLVEHYPVQVIDIIIQNNLLPLLMDHLHHQAVIDSLYTLVVVRPNVADMRTMISRSRSSLFRYLTDFEFLPKLFKAIVDPTPRGSITATGAAELAVRVMEELPSEDASDVVFRQIAGRIPLLQQLVTTTLDLDVMLSPHQQSAAARVLLGLLVHSAQKPYAPSPYATFGISPVPNHLAILHPRIHNVLRKHTAEFCYALLINPHDISGPGGTVGRSVWKGKTDYSVLTGGASAPRTLSAAAAAAAEEFANQPRVPVDASGLKYKTPGFSVSQPFTSFRLTLMEILAEMVVESGAEVLDDFVPEIWRVFAAWFLEYRYNSLYQTLFFRIFEVAVSTNNEGSLKLLLSKYKLLTRMIDVYGKKEASGELRGFILLMANHIRLKADLLSDSGVEAWLGPYLRSHDAWRKFLPKLKADTIAQTSSQFNVDRSKPPHFAPRPPRSRSPAPDSWSPTDSKDDSIELGSVYSRVLGYTPAPGSAAAEAAAKKLPAAPGSGRAPGMAGASSSPIFSGATGADIVQMMLSGDDDDDDSDDSGNSASNNGSNGKTNGAEANGGAKKKRKRKKKKKGKGGAGGGAQANGEATSSSDEPSEEVGSGSSPWTMDAEEDDDQENDLEGAMNALSPMYMGISRYLSTTSSDEGSEASLGGSQAPGKTSPARRDSGGDGAPPQLDMTRRFSPAVQSDASVEQ